MFSDLISRFPVSDDLFAWLRSAAGGKLVVRTDKMTPERPFVLIHYDKESSDMTLDHVGLFRSVIWNANTNRPVCMSPVRGLTYDAAVEAGVTPGGAGVTVEDFADGVMINMFHDGHEWTLATRTQLGAQNSFYGKRTFAELFWETFTNAGLTHDMLSVDTTYSWVLQHPEERIVVAPNYGIARLYLVESSAVIPESLSRFVPPRYTDLSSLSDVKERVAAWGERFGAKWQGLVIKADGKRYKLRSVQYIEARHLRGNQAKRTFVWLERWSDGHLGDYTKLYPEEKAEAEALIQRFKTCTQELFDMYQRVYRRRELRLGDAPQKYRKLLWDCHAANAGAYFPNTRKFMNKQDTARKLWLCNYELRYGVSQPAASE